MKVALACLLLAAACGAASASGGIGCEGSAGKARFEIDSGVTRGMGSPVFQFKATVTTTATAIEPDLRRVEFTDAHLAQYWLDGKELKMVLYRERETGDHGYVELTLLTRARDEGSYAGTVDIRYFETRGDTSGEGQTVNLAGKASCFVE